MECSMFDLFRDAPGWWWLGLSIATVLIACALLVIIRAEVALRGLARERELRR